MASVSVTKTIEVSAQEAWAVLSTFRGIEEISPIAKSVVEGEGKGAKRICTMPDGANIYETLNEVDHTAKHMEYAITTGPFPVSNYVSTIDVQDKGTSCEITWACTFESAPEVEEEMKGLFGGFYNVIIESLEKKIKEEVAA